MYFINHFKIFTFLPCLFLFLQNICFASFSDVLQKYRDFGTVLFPDYPLITSGRPSEVETVPLEVRISDRGKVLHEIKERLALVGYQHSFPDKLKKACFNLLLAKKKILENDILATNAQEALARDELIREITNFSSSLDCEETSYPVSTN